MMPGIARKTTDTAGGPHLAGGQDTVTANGQIVVVLGDPVTPHGILLHAAPIMVEASSTVSAGGIPVCRQGDLANCGDASTGSGNVSVGGGKVTL